MGSGATVQIISHVWNLPLLTIAQATARGEGIIGVSLPWRTLNNSDLLARVIDRCQGPLSKFGHT